MYVFIYFMPLPTVKVFYALNLDIKKLEPEINQR